MRLLGRGIISKVKRQTYSLVFVAKQFGATEFVNPKEVKSTVEDAIVAMTDGGCDYTFECIGNVKTMVRSYSIW